MTLKVIILSLFIFSSATLQAKKSNYPFYLMVGMADVIVTGEIRYVLGDSCYMLSVNQTVKGKTEKQINVKIFQNWACDVRWKKPEAGQKLFLFLTKNGSGYETIGGSDGEIFIIDDKLRLYNPFNWQISQHFKEANSPRLDAVVIAVKNFLSCYSFTGNKNLPYTFLQIKKGEEILVLKHVNAFSVWLFDRITPSMCKMEAAI